jgi:hypothetical protein
LKVAADMKLEVPLSTRTQELWHQTLATLPPGSSVSELVRSLETRSGIELSPKG